VYEYYCIKEKLFKRKASWQACKQVGISGGTKSEALKLSGYSMVTKLNDKGL